MNAYFLCGILMDAGLQTVIFGRQIRAGRAEVPGAGLATNGGYASCCIAANGDGVTGICADLDDADHARLMFFAKSLDWQVVSVQTDQGIEAGALVSKCEPGAMAWNQGAWDANWGDLMRLAAEDLMRSYGSLSQEKVKLVMGQIMGRAASRLRAMSDPSPIDVRQGLTQNNVTIQSLDRPYLDFFMIEEQILTFQRFDGAQSAPVKRAAFVSGDAVTVLPYDPVRDRVLIIEQFRMAPLARGDAHPWSLEVIAGRIDPGETPEQAARREAVEETGLTLRNLEHIVNYYPTSGAVSEYLYSYAGLVDLPDSIAGVGGLDSEDEDIRSILLSFEELIALLRSGEAENGPLILSAYWLAANRDRLRANA